MRFIRNVVESRAQQGFYWSLRTHFQRKISLGSQNKLRGGPEAPLQKPFPKLHVQVYSGSIHVAYTAIAC